MRLSLTRNSFVPLYNLNGLTLSTIFGLLSVRKIRRNSLNLPSQIDEVTSLLKQIDQDRKTLRRNK